MTERMRSTRRIAIPLGLGLTMLVSVASEARAQVELGVGLGGVVTGFGKLEGAAGVGTTSEPIVLHQQVASPWVSGHARVTWYAKPRVTLELSSLLSTVDVFIDEPQSAGPPRFTTVDRGTIWSSSLRVAWKSTTFFDHVAGYVFGGPAVLIATGRGFSGFQGRTRAGAELGVGLSSVLGRVPVRLDVANLVYRPALRQSGVFATSASTRSVLSIALSAGIVRF